MSVCGSSDELQRSLCAAISRSPKSRVGLLPRFPLENAFTVDWLHPSRSANCCCVSPVASNSSVIFLVSISTIITFVFNVVNT